MDRILEYVVGNNIELVLTPTNASWLNPIEAHVGRLVKFALANFNPRDHAEIARNVRRYMSWRNARHNQTPTKSVRRKGVKEEKPRLCGKCGMEILERH